MKIAKKEKLVELEICLDQKEIGEMVELLVRAQRAKFGMKEGQKYKVDWSYDSEVAPSHSIDRPDTAVINGIRIKITDIE